MHSEVAQQRKSVLRHSIREHFTLGPSEGRYVPLGVFETGIRQPHFKLSYDPAPSNVISASLKRIEGKGEYQLVYFFQNFADKPYNVTVQEVA